MRSAAAHPNSGSVRPIQKDMGAYRRCLVQARVQGVTGGGLVVILGMIDGGGGVQARLVSSTVQALLGACLRQAVEEVWHYPVTRAVPRHRRLVRMSVTIPFRLSPALLSPPDERPQRARPAMVEHLARAALDR